MSSWSCCSSAWRRRSCPAPAAAQQPPPAPAPEVSAADLRALAATLEDEGRRKELLATIRALIAAKDKPSEVQDVQNALGGLVLGFAVDAARDAQDSIGELAGYFKGWPVLVAWVKQEWSNPAARAQGLNEAIAFLTIFVMGWIAEAVVWRLLARNPPASRHCCAQARLGPHPADPRPPDGRSAAARSLCRRRLCQRGVHRADPKVRTVALNLVNAYLTARVLIAVARVLVAPTSPSLRMLRLHNATAVGLFGWFRRFAIVSVAGYFLIAAAYLLGLPRRGANVLFTGLGFIVAMLAIVFVLRHRAQVAGWLRRRSAGASQLLGLAQLLQALAAVWHVLAVAYIGAFFVIAAFDIKGGFTFMLRGTLGSLLVVAMAWLVLVGVSALINRGLPHAALEAAPHSVARARLSSYLPVVGGVLRTFVVAGAALVLLEVWGIGAFDALREPLGQRMVGSVVSILLVLAFAVVVWEIASNAIAVYLTKPAQDGSARPRSARVRTLLPLLRKALFVFLSVMVVLISLSEIGVDIAPLLAGAGVVGLAIGFGAQKLVQDVITGVFILVEDAMAVGDVVTVAGIGGLVEDMSIRSIRLRDLSGNVHTVPFSSVGTVTNMTKDFSYYLLDIAVDYGQDTDHVAEVCTEIVEGLRADPILGPDILEPLEILGVDQIGNSSAILKARIKTRPIKQWAIGREFNRRMIKRFKEAGIGFPFPHHTVYLGLDNMGDMPPLRVQVEGDGLRTANDAASGPSVPVPETPRDAAPEAPPALPPVPPSAAPSGGRRGGRPRRQAPQPATRVHSETPMSDLPDTDPPDHDER